MSADPSIESSAVSLATAVGVTRECLSFRLGEAQYGIDILRVQEIRN